VPPEAMDEPIQTTTSSKPGFDRSMLWNFRVRSRSMEMVKAAMIYDVLRLSVIYSLPMDSMRHYCASISNG